MRATPTRASSPARPTRRCAAPTCSWACRARARRGAAGRRIGDLALTPADAKRGQTPAGDVSSSVGAHTRTKRGQTPFGARLVGSGSFAAQALHLVQSLQLLQGVGLELAHAL